MLTNLRILRESKGLTQTQLAQIVGVSQQSIQKYETSEVEPDIEILKRLADAFDVSVDFLIDHQICGEEPRFPITKSEFTLVEHYRRIDPESRKVILNLLKILPDKKGRP